METRDGNTSAPSTPVKESKTTVEDIFNELNDPYVKLISSISLESTPTQLRFDICDATTRKFDRECEPREVAHNYVKAWNSCAEVQKSLSGRKSSQDIPKIRYMYADAIAHCLVRWYRVARINQDGKDIEARRDLLAMYCDSGPDEGVYAECGSIFRMLVRAFNPDANVRLVEDVLSTVYDLAPILRRCDDVELTLVGNGIFDGRTKTLRPFDPGVVFTSKIRTNFNPDANGDVTFDDPEVGTWSLDAWLLEIAGGDLEIVRQLDAVTMACVRPRLKWEQAAFLYNDTGRNGKGTLLAMWRNLVGPASCASVPLDKLGDRFALSSLMGKSLNLVDEVPVGTAIKDAGVFKALITHDTVYLDRKNQQPIECVFEVFMVLCPNEMPYIMDKTASMKRRLMFISLPECFTGRANKRIKTTYVVSREVAEALLFRALHAEYEEIPSSSASEALMNDYERQNEPLLDFFDRVEKVLCGDMYTIQPYKCAITTSIDEVGQGCASYAALYNWYKGWRKKYSPKTSELSLAQFTKQMNKIAKSRPERNIWVNCETGGQPISLCGGQAATIAGDSQWGQFQMYFNGEWHRVDDAFEAFLNGEGSDSPITFRWCAETASHRAKGLRFDVEGYRRKHVPEDVFNVMTHDGKRRSTQRCHEHVEYHDFFECVVKETKSGSGKYALPAEEAWRASGGVEKVLDATGLASTAESSTEDAA